MRIAVIGLAAAGKGTIARIVAKRLQLHYIDCGLLFRLCAYLNGSQQSAAYVWDGQYAKVTVNDADVTSELFHADIASRASLLAEKPESATYLFQFANMLMRDHDRVIVDGRNAGTDLLPDAEHVFHVTASLETRAKRRHAQLLALGSTISYEAVCEALRVRDERDTNRTFAPFAVPKRAVVVDTDVLTADDAAVYISAITKGV